MASPQFVLASRLSKHYLPLWHEPLVLPAYFAAVSVLFLSFQLLWREKRVKRLASPSILESNVNTSNTTSNATSLDHHGLVSHIKQIIKSLGATVFFLRALRLLSCLALLAITVVPFVQCNEDTPLNKNTTVETFSRGWSKHAKKKRRHEVRIHHEQWIELALCAFYTYTSLLSLLHLTVGTHFRKTVGIHLAVLLLAAMGIYIQRDVWPLATFSLKLLDGASEWKTWARIGLLGFASILLPVLTPREYTPVDPTNPSQPFPEQTASPLSFVTFSFLDPLIWESHKTPHLPYERLPPLADSDRSVYLKATGFPTVDPMLQSKPRHIFWGLMQYFRFEYVIMTGALTAQSVLALASPLAVNRLLSYIETDGKNAYIRPWVWVAVLFFSRFIPTMLFETYVFFATRTLVRVEGILTQLIFEHALRMRVKEDAGKASPSASISGSTSGTTPSSPKSHTTRLLDGDEEGDLSAALDAGTLAAVSSSESTDAAPSKDVIGDAAPAAEASSPEDMSNKDVNLIGQLNTLLGQDLANVGNGRDFLLIILWLPARLIFTVMFLYTLLGWSAFVGMAVMVIGLPIPGKISVFIERAQKESMSRTDSRVQSVTETISVIRMVKMFGWEKKAGEQMAARREDELYWIKKRMLLGLLNMVVNWILPLLVMVITFSVYTLVMHQPLTASIVWFNLIILISNASSLVMTDLTVFDRLKELLHSTFFMIPFMTQCKVSLDRVNDFLHTTELLDRFTAHEGISEEFNTPGTDRDAIGFHNATFAWSQSQASDPVSSTSSRRNFLLNVEGNIFFQRGAINLIVGPTGSGKTSLLLALLGELHFSPKGPDAWYNLPRDKGIAYAAQEPWVQNETIKDNIVFGAEFDAERYKKVLHQCALEKDLTVFSAGDETEVGEKGLTLSGGQKARVSLARAVYSSAEIILLDDVLSALDMHTSRWVIDKCLTGDLLQGRTVIMVTHNIAMVGPIAQHVVSISSSGKITSQKLISEALKQNNALRAELEHDNEVITKADEAVDDVVEAPQKVLPASGKLMTEEEVVLGHLSWKAVKLYSSSAGGLVFWILFVGISLLSDIFEVLQTWYLGFWASQYDSHTVDEVNVGFYIGLYALLMMLGALCFAGSYGVYFWGSLNASRRIHQLLVDAILGTTLRFLDKTPIGRIIARFTQDIRSIDSPLPENLRNSVQRTTALLAKFSSIIIMTPIFVPLGFAFAIIGALISLLYIGAQLAVKREMSNARSPLFSHLGASVGGLTSIRAYGAEERFKQESLRRIDKYTRPARSFYNLHRWISLRIDGLGGIFAGGLAAYLVYVRGIRNASSAGFQLNMAVSFTSLLLWWVRNLNDLEVEGNSVERIKHYIDIEQEPKPVSWKKPPAAWPTSGSLRIEHLNARYSQDGPNVLHDVSFEVKPGEKVGVVGRTGSGKSSLTLALLQLIPTDGQIIYDGIPTSELNLKDLRGNITIIPQQPELLSGTIRQNLDPFGQHEDAALNDALHAAGLFSLQSELPQEQRITLESNVGSGGGNFSIGQRQILALARALVRQSKVLILDEATASLDHRTDTLVQQSLKNEFHESTLITIAHRLQTIMNSDKILVLDAGKLVEFDSPLNLLAKESGAFKSLVDGSGAKEALYALAMEVNGN